MEAQLDGPFLQLIRSNFDNKGISYIEDIEIRNVLLRYFIRTEQISRVTLPWYQFIKSGSPFIRLLMGP